MRRFLLFVLIILSVAGSSWAEGTLVFLVPTGEMQNGLEVFRKMKPSDADYFKARNKFTRGFMAESVYLHGLMQNYLLKKGKIKEKYPLYLALTDHQGGWARKGLVLVEEGNQRKELPNAWYVDLHRKALEENPADLGSYHQILPHETAHVILGLLLGKPEVFSSKVHYFCTQTDPRLAFSEGFAESFQYVSIITEQDPRIKRSIQENVRDIGISFTREIHAFRRDFSWPARLGFYRAAMPKWYEDLENYRRYNFIESKLVQRPARTIENSDPWMQRLYLDAAVWPDIRHYRTLENAVATEGVMAAFFGYMIQSDLKKNYYPPEYYRDFFPADSGFVFEREIYPLRNQYLKIFTVLDKYVNFNNASVPPIIQFIDGYIREFPAEEQIVKAIWKESSGVDYTSDVSMELWVVNSRAHFIPWVMSSFGPLSKTYPFNLNAADSVDLVCLEGFRPADAPLWLEARKQKGGFSSLNEAASVEGLSRESSAALQSLQLLNQPLQNGEKQISLSSLIIYPLWHFLKWGFLWYLPLALVYLLVARLTHKPSNYLNYLFNFLFFFVFILISAASVLWVDKNILFISVLTLLILGIKISLGIRKKSLPWPSVALTLGMALVIIYSLY
ncbi:MAG: hypothetical protein ACP5O2_11215 [Bacteroidales bacterium]